MKNHTHFLLVAPSSTKSIEYVSQIKLSWKVNIATIDFKDLFSDNKQISIITIIL